MDTGVRTFDLRLLHAIHATTVCEPRERESVECAAMGGVELEGLRDVSFDIPVASARGES